MDGCAICGQPLTACACAAAAPPRGRGGPATAPASDAEILMPVRELVIRGETVAIRELAWPQALEFFRLLVAELGRVVGQTGKLEITPESLAGLVAGVDALSRYLILKSTGRDDAWLNGLTVREALNVLDAALALNLSAELVGKLKNVTARLAALGVNPTVSARSTPS